MVRRPWARGAEDIGTWQDIIDLITAAAVITNAALIVFTMNDLLDYTLEFKFWVFIGFQWVVFSFQYLVRCLVPDVPFDVDIFLERQTVFNDKLIDMDEDDNYEEAKEEYQRLSRVREIVGPVKASVLTDEELKKYLPTEQTETEKHRQIQVKRLFNEATEHLKTNIVASETRDSDVRQSISETEIVADANTNYPKNPRTSADMRLTFAIDEMTRYSESAPPAISPSSPRFEANEEPIHEDDEQVEVEEEGQQEDFAEEGEQDDGEEHLE